MSKASSNLVINVCDAMEKGGTLTIRADKFFEQTTAPPHLATVARNFGRLTVEDTGRRVRQQAVNNLHRPAASGKSPSEEAGMELAIVDAIVTRNDGYIVVESGEGLGTRISVLLPQARTGTASGQSERPQDKSA